MEKHKTSLFILCNCYWWHCSRHYCLWIVCLKDLKCQKWFIFQKHVCRFERVSQTSEDVWWLMLYCIMLSNSKYFVYLWPTWWFGSFLSNAKLGEEIKVQNNSYKWFSSLQRLHCHCVCDSGKYAFYETLLYNMFMTNLTKNLFSFMSTFSAARTIQKEGGKNSYHSTSNLKGLYFLITLPFIKQHSVRV